MGITQKLMVVVARVGTPTFRLSKWGIRSIGYSLLALSTAYAAGWGAPIPQHLDLCPVLRYRLNHTATPCIATAIGLYPGFTFPGTTVDGNKHLELIAKLIAYGGSPLTYFKAPLNNLADRIQFAREFVQAGGTLKIWHTRLLAYYGSGVEDPAPPGDQTIAILSRKMWSPNCPAYASLYSSEAFVVLPDLSGPDPRVEQGAASLLAHTTPVLYKGKTLLVSYGFSADGKGELYDYDRVNIYDPSVVVNGPGCWLEYHRNDRNSGK